MGLVEAVPAEHHLGDGEELELAPEGAVGGGGADDEEDDGAVECVLGFAGLAVGGDDRGEASDGDVGVDRVEAAAGGEGGVVEVAVAASLVGGEAGFCVGGSEHFADGGVDEVE